MKEDRVELSAEELAKIKDIKNSIAKVKENWRLLQYENAEQLGKEAYQIVTAEAVKQNGSALEYVQSDKLSKKHYQMLCTQVVTKDGLALRYVNSGRFGKNSYKALCIGAVQQNGEALEYVQAERLRKEDYPMVGEEAVKQNSSALEYIKENKLDSAFYQRLCVKAVTQNWLVLGFVQADKLDKLAYQALCVGAVKKNSNALEYVQAGKLDKEIYQGLCSDAITKNAFALEHADVEVLDSILYQTLCMKAITQNGLALEYVKAKKLDTAFYLTLCRKAIQQDSLALDSITEGVLDAPSYQKMCVEAVKKNGLALAYAKVNILDSKGYQTICIEAVKQNGLALQCVDPGNIDKGVYQILCAEAVKQNGLALEYVESARLGKEAYKALCKSAIEQNELALKYVPIEMLMANRALVTRAIGVYPLILTKIAITATNKQDIINSVLKIGIEKILSENAALIPFLRMLMADNSTQLHKIVDCMEQINSIVVTHKGLENYEIADTYHVYKEKREGKGRKFIQVTTKDLEWFLKELNDIRIKNKIKGSLSLILLGHSSEGATHIAALSMDKVARIVEANKSIDRVIILGCHTAKSKPLEDEAKMIEKFRAIESEKKAGFFFLASLSPMLFSTDTLKFPKGYHEGYILNRKSDTSYELVYVVEKDIKQRYDLNAMQINAVKKLLKPGGQLNFPKREGQLNTFSESFDVLHKERLEEILGEIPSSQSDYKESKTYLPYLTSITLKPAEKDKLQASLMKRLVAALENTIKDTERYVLVKGYTKAVHVDIKEKRLQVSADPLFKEEYSTEFYRSKKDTINRDRLFAARKKERAVMKGTLKEETLAKAVKVNVTKKP